MHTTSSAPHLPVGPHTTTAPGRRNPAEDNNSGLQLCPNNYYHQMTVQRKFSPNLKSYLMTFLVIMTILSMTLIIICSQVELTATYIDLNSSLKTIPRSLYQEASTSKTPSDLFLSRIMLQNFQMVIVFIIKIIIIFFVIAGNLVQFVGSKFMAPASVEISEHSTENT